MKPIETVLGFSKSEKKVWKTLESAGEGLIVAEVAFRSNLPRMTVHKILHRFIARGLVGRSKHAKRFYYHARSLGTVLQEALADTSASTSLELPLSPNTHIRTYVGLDAMLTRIRTLAEAYRHERWSLLQSSASAAAIMENVPLSTITELNRIIFQNEQITDLYVEANFIDCLRSQLTPESFTTWLASLARTSIVYLLPPGYVHTKNDLMVFRQSVYILNWHELTLCEISHTDTVAMMKKLLASVEGAAEKTDLYRLVGEYQRNEA